MKERIYITVILADKVDAWTLTAKKDSKSISALVGLDDSRLGKKDIKFINDHIKLFLGIKADIRPSTHVQADS